MGNKKDNVVKIVDIVNNWGVELSTIPATFLFGDVWWESQGLESRYGPTSRSNIPVSNANCVFPMVVETL